MKTPLAAFNPKQAFFYVSFNPLFWDDARPHAVRKARRRLVRFQ